MSRGKTQVMIGGGGEVVQSLGIPPEKELIAGIAVGYPVADSAFNTFERTRVPADKITSWLE